MTADMGVSTYDAIALIITHKWKLGRFRVIRVATDSMCIALGISMFLLAGKTENSMSSLIGVGTILTAFCMGPLIDSINRTISMPLLSRNSDKRLST